MGLLKEHLEKLRVLIAIEQAGSIARAAPLLHTTAAAVSQSIKVLEQTLGYALLVREPRGVRLTPRGRILHDFASRLYLEADSVESQLADLEGVAAGELRIGTHETLAIHLFPRLLESLRRLHPQVSAILSGGRIDGLLSALANSEYHVVVSVEPIPRANMCSKVLFEGVMGLFASMATPPVLSLEQARRRPILTDRSAHIRQDLPIPEFLSRNGFSIDKPIELNSFETAMRVCEQGDGIALVPESHAAEALRYGRLRRVQVEGIDPGSFGRYRICASWMNWNRSYAPLEAFLGVLASQEWL